MAGRLPHDYLATFFASLHTTNSEFTFDVLFKFVTKTIMLLEQGSISATEKTGSNANTRANKITVHMINSTQSSPVESKPPDGAVMNEATMKPKVCMLNCVSCVKVYIMQDNVTSLQC